MAQVNLGHVVGPGVPTGGTANQILTKNSSTNFDTSWKAANSIPSVENLQNGLAIVANGNTHAAIDSGQFVYVKNHSSLSEGLYRASAAIGTNGTLSTSNLVADGSGGLNALKSAIPQFANRSFLGEITTDGGNVTITADPNLPTGATLLLKSIYNIAASSSVNNITFIGFVGSNTIRVVSTKAQTLTVYVTYVYTV